VHDPGADDPSAAFALSRLDSPDLGHVPMGIFRNVTRPTYDDLLREQVASARTGPVTDADIDALLAGRDTWTVGA
jgi:2-oxoglutarate ferredoxin oxidoreductase subunit beta